MATTPVAEPGGERDYSGPPSADEPVPPAVCALAAGRPVRGVWRNELGGLTYEISEPAGRSFVKWAPAGSGLDLSAEAVRLRWAVRFVPVPRVLDSGADADGAWLLTEGESAVSDRWTADPATAVTAIGTGLRALHDALPVEECPFSWSAEDRLATVHDRDAAGLLDPANWSPEHAGLTRKAALRLLAAVPPVDRLVVCHGDACSPNTLVADDGSCSGHVDMGDLGVADRWADIAIATWALEWNYGPGWDGALLDAYGIDPDPERTAYYRLLWDLGP